LNAQRVSWIWAAIVAACVAWQRLLLGLYCGDLALWVDGSTKGSPFSLTRLLFTNFTISGAAGLPAGVVSWHHSSDAQLDNCHRGSLVSP